jgi:hypothetical protein
MLSRARQILVSEFALAQNTTTDDAGTRLLEVLQAPAQEEAHSPPPAGPGHDASASVTSWTRPPSQTPGTMRPTGTRGAPQSPPHLLQDTGKRPVENRPVDLQISGNLRLRNPGLD